MADPLRVVAAVVVDRETVFACRRREGKSGAGEWEFPGGKVDPGEVAEDALRREIREELGVEIEVLGLLHREQTLVGSATIDLACYLCRFAEEDPTVSTDHDRLTWQPIESLRDLNWAVPDIPTVRLLAEQRRA